MIHTSSICPVCFKKIPAAYIQKGNDIFLEKNCPEHGNFSTIIWRNDADTFLSFPAWHEDNSTCSCPTNCGLCTSHLQDTCCIELELTSRCNLSCPYCLENKLAKEPSFEEIKSILQGFIKEGRSFLHLTGGEPTLREDLFEIIELANKLGFSYIQLNSNGIRIAEEENYAKRLKESGLSFVFLQFDGTNDEIYKKTRGVPLFNLKKRAISQLAMQNLGVALVPTLVPGINISNIGNILEFAIAHSPAVRGVHFQPVSYFGRYPSPPTNEMRFTLPELIAEINRQSQIGPECFRYSTCDHPACGFHGDFVVMPDGLISITKEQHSSENTCCSCSSNKNYTSVEKNREFIGRRWKRTEADSCCCSSASEDLDSLDGFLNRIQTHGFTITAMAFQDAYTLDIERLRHCSLHIYDNGKIMPFCLRYTVR